MKKVAPIKGLRANANKKGWRKVLFGHFGLKICSKLLNRSQTVLPKINISALFAHFAQIDYPNTHTH